MSQTVIRVEGLGKRYRIDERGQHTALRHVIGDALGAPLRLLGGKNNGSNNRSNRRSGSFIWSLKNVSFEIQQGDVVGLVGRNGAGKSTLLKILARITRPTEGYAEIRGRVGSLLEVGTGFHGELTGRENVYMSGAVLGMRKAEIERKFDEIVAFSEVERFLDTPLKHYSSGMQMRLAFAVAAHLEPEILFVDEVLAVGDISFQKKCLSKMSDVASHGRTILFVSHNIAAITRLCSRCVLLQNGTVLKDGEPHDIISTYLRSELKTQASREWRLVDAPGNSTVRLRAVKVRSLEGLVAETFDIRRPIGIDLVFDVLEEGEVLVPNIHLVNEEGRTAFVSMDQDEAWYRRPRVRGRYSSTAWIPGNFLSEGPFTVHAAVTTYYPETMKVHLHEPNVIGFQVRDSEDGKSARGDYKGTLPGIVRPLLVWETAYDPEPSERSLLELTTADQEAYEGAPQ